MARKWTNKGEITDGQLSPAQIADHGKYRLGDQYLEHGINILAKFCKNIIEYAEAKGSSAVAQKIKKIIREDSPALATIVAENDKKSKTVYQLSKDNKIPFRKLLYELRKIDFPLCVIKRGRHNNRIAGDHLALFNGILHTIKVGIYCEQTKKEWIALFRNMGWEKSRISQFIRRHIKYGLVPNHFFDCLRPTQEWILKILNNKPLTDLPRLDYGREGLRDMARAMITESKKTVFTVPR